MSRTVILQYWIFMWFCALKWLSTFDFTYLISWNGQTNYVWIFNIQQGVQLFLYFAFKVKHKPSSLFYLATLFSNIMTSWYQHLPKPYTWSNKVSFIDSITNQLNTFWLLTWAVGIHIGLSRLFQRLEQCLVIFKEVLLLHEWLMKTKSNKINISTWDVTMMTITLYRYTTCCHILWRCVFQ